MTDAATKHGNAGPAPRTEIAFTRLAWAPELCVLEVRGDLDIATSESLRLELVELFESGVGRVEVDLSGVEFMDSSALNVLVQANERAKATGQLFSVRNPSPVCAKVFGITGLDHVFGLR